MSEINTNETKVDVYIPFVLTTGETSTLHIKGAIRGDEWPFKDKETRVLKVVGAIINIDNEGGAE
jgi:hypothetical protein